MSEVHKINTISQAEYKINRLYENIDKVEGRLSSRIASVREQATREAEKRARDLIEKERNRMKEALDKEISDVNSSIKELDKEQRRRLKETAKNLEEMIDTQADSIRRETRRNISDLKGEIGKLASDTRKQLNEQSRRMDKLAEASKKRYDTLQSRISQLSKETLKRFDEQQRQLDSHDKQLANLEASVNSILDHFNSEEQKRQEAVEMAKAIYKAAFKRTPIDRFNPEEAARVHDRMNRLLSNANDSTARNQAIEAIMRIQWAEEKALKAKIIYDAVLNEALESLDAVLSEVNSNREIKVADPNCEGEVVTIETDFWNRGKYTDIIKNLEALKVELNTQPDLERIEKITKEIARYEAEATEMVSKAGQQSVLSENRVVITEDIVTALLDQGWQIEQNSAGDDEVGYEGGEVDHDWREGVYAYLRSMNGERIVIRVIPTEDSIANEIAFHRVDNRSMTADEFMRSLRNLKNQIEKSGHKLGDFQVPARDGGNSKLTEVSSPSQLGKKGASQSIRRKTRGV